MRRLLIALAVIGLWFIGGRAQAADCVTIKDSDQRANYSEFPNSWKHDRLTIK